MSHTRTHQILDFEVTLEAGHRAWDTYEKLGPGRSVLVATNLKALWSSGISMVYEFGYSLARKWMDGPGAQYAPSGWTYETWLDALPPVGSESWNELHTKVSDLVCLPFYNKTWGEMLKALEDTCKAIEAAEVA